jgi:hypothetical protein
MRIWFRVQGELLMHHVISTASEANIASVLPLLLDHGFDINTCGSVCDSRHRILHACATTPSAY